MNPTESSGQVLFVTVGSGNPQALEETLYTPISKSIDSPGDWERVVFLPSQATSNHAHELKKRHWMYDVHIRPLPPAAENDADRCYDHFQHVIAELGRVRPEKMVVDITRGTKAMSAALLLAAFRHRISAIRYVEGERDPANPAVIRPGSERVRDVRAHHAVYDRTLDEARLLLLRGDCAAAAHLLRDFDAHPQAVGARRLAEFYAAWDRFDYRAAHEIGLDQQVPADWATALPSEATRHWVHQLAAPLRDDYRAKAERVRRLAVDVFRNGERRIRQRQFEDAVVRAYRVLEMVGQARLFDRGLDSAALPSDHPVICKLRTDLRKKGSADFGENRDGTLNAGRELVARTLERLDDGLAGRLLELAKKEYNDFCLADRNRSILIHGFVAVGPSEDVPLRRLYDDLATLLRADCVQADAWLTAARFPVGGA